ncbi:MAG: acetyl-CoA carboxylase biotin carboxylase subunit, partial [Pseudomonadota bacterium]
MQRFKKILVANRGEIAVRVFRTARSMGYQTVAVFSDADRNAFHTSQADEAIFIGPSNPAESYLCIDKIIAAAKSTDSGAIHPGYGFLSENAEFARRCDEEGIIFIGPSAAAIELMGSKRLSKLAMLESNVPCIPGYQGDDQGDDTLVEQAQRIGMPVMIKASAGGGGRGMRVVHDTDDIASQIEAARAEAKAAFGNDELIMERALIEPRHIEIQVFGDEHGNVVHLGERDCSIQRRHQKIVEEAPSPFVDEELRTAMGEAAVNAAKACQYRGAGTVEFLVDQKREFFFLEMNTRLQVEHPVTEMITGLDLVAWQLLVADGQELPLAQAEISQRGHAVEVRLCAEDPRQDCLPQTGLIAHWQPSESKDFRLDAGIQAQQVVSPFYDSLIAKAIAWGETRSDAISKLIRGLRNTELLGVHHNKHFLLDILEQQEFQLGEATTGFLGKIYPDNVYQPSAINPHSWAVAAALFYRRSQTI